MRDAIFCYGTLQFADVFAKVTGLRLPSQTATLPGYRRRQIRGECFPGIIADSNASTVGLVYRGLDSARLVRLDRFEADFYRRYRLLVHTDRGEALQAWVYVVEPRYAHLLREHDWDPARFRKHDLARFLRRA
jgi:gamma-glutamylcyclotransferase (GGCT)/AIG2-like uncharacterized protein YtfP